MERRTARENRLSPIVTLNAFIERLSIRYGGAKPRELERFIKFFLVGAIGFVVDFGMLNLLQSTVLKPVPDSPLPVILATTVAFTSAIISNFIWNRYWTYPDSRSRSVARQVVQFFVVNIAGWIFRLGIVTLLYAPFGVLAAGSLNSLWPETITTPAIQDQLGTNMAQALAVVIVMFWNFFVNRYWTYNDVE